MPEQSAAFLHEFMDKLLPLVCIGSSPARGAGKCEIRTAAAQNQNSRFSTDTMNPTVLPSVIHMMFTIPRVILDDE